MKEERGYPPYHPEMMVALLYAYSQGCIRPDGSPGGAKSGLIYVR